MKVLVATRELQGTAPQDYSYTLEGELVTPVVGECRSPDRCGCGRGFGGLASSRATTTAMVVERPNLTPLLLDDAVHAWLERSGWRELFADDELDDAAVDALLAEIADEHLEAIAEICGHFPVGTVVERRGSHVSARSVPRAA